MLSYNQSSEAEHLRSTTERQVSTVDTHSPRNSWIVGPGRFLDLLAENDDSFTTYHDEM